MAGRRSANAAPNIWPGFVDALAALLVVIIFLLVVFVLAQVFLTQALSGRDQALERLNSQVNELAELLALERDTTTDLRTNLTQLSSSLQQSTSERDQLVLRLDALAANNEDLSRQVLALSARTNDAEAELQENIRTTEVDRESIRTQLGEIESLRRDIQALRQVRDDLEGKVAGLATALEEAEKESDAVALDLEKSQQLEAVLREQSAELDTALQEIRSVAGALRDRSLELETNLATEEERTLLAQTEVEEREVRLSELQGLYAARGRDLEEQRSVSSGASVQVATLNQQLLALRQQLLSLQSALEAAETKDTEQNVVISDLGSRLNQALAQKVEELSRYRSEFFGRLREVLGNRRDITVVGDRFVFQSEVLFSSGSANLGTQGQSRLAELAATLLDIAPSIPTEIPWILRVDGHTDSIPIATPQFPSNWELSSARAISVIQYLIERGVPANRLAAAGFGEFQPLDPGNDEIANRRNRRIELKLTER